jgi:DNA-binding response OmpR family regulator
VSRILVIDDDPMVRRVLSMLLGSAGHSVDAVGRVDAGREMLATGSHDLVLLDLNLRDGNGFDLLTYAREDLRLTVPVIIFSGMQQEANVLRGLGHGAVDFVAKPFDPQAVVDLVARWTGVRHASDP